MVERKNIDVSDFGPMKCNGCGHVNDPYPEKGKCLKCGNFLPNNPYKIEVGNDLAERKSVAKKTMERRAKQYVEDAGLKWKDIDALTQDLALRAAKTRDRHDSMLLLEQLELRKARPQPQDAHIDAEFVVTLSGETIEALENSLGALNKLLKDS